MPFGFGVLGSCPFVFDWGRGVKSDVLTGVEKMDGMEVAKYKAGRGEFLKNNSMGIVCDF